MPFFQLFIKGRVKLGFKEGTSIDREIVIKKKDIKKIQ